MKKVLKALIVAILIFMFPLTSGAENELYTSSVSGEIMLKISPDDKSAEIMSIPACSKVKVLKKINTWGLVSFEKKCGWINLSFTAENYTDAANSTGKDAVEFASNCVLRTGTEQTVSLTDIAYKAQVNNTTPAETTQTHTSPVSPPPYMVGMVEIELDKLTGKVDIIDYMAVVDCGIPINPALATIQTEGGIVQGIGHTLMENVTYDSKGRPAESSFMQYKIPTRLDMGRLKVEFEHSYEPTGPFGAKSIGEIVINTPGPAIAHAIYRATGKWFRELPITPEQIAMSLTED